MSKINVKPCAASNSPKCWEDINFKIAIGSVKKLQKRIAGAKQDGNIDKVYALQHKLIHSFYAKAVAVRIVTSNRGKYTPGIDGVIWLTPEDKWNAIFNLNRRGYSPNGYKRVYIPKSNGKKRLLSIPTMRDRAMQTLYKLALEPIAELEGDANSYGFRYNRCTRDAVLRCIEIFNSPPFPEWILEADIKACFDNISHKWIIDNIPVDKKMLPKLYADNTFNNYGIPQGGCLSPTICNMALDGLEKLLNDKFNNRVQFVRYADDFVVVGENPYILRDDVIPVVNCFLSVRGLHLSTEKTFISNVQDGFDFLGWNIRKKENLLSIVPSEKNINSLFLKVESLFNNSSYIDIDDKLKAVLIGWLNYHKCIVDVSALYDVYDNLIRVLNEFIPSDHWEDILSSVFCFF